MGKSSNELWKARIRKLISRERSRSELTDRLGRRPSDMTPSQALSLSSVENFYQHQLTTNLRNFEKFARQSQSRLILDVFARGATNGRQSLMGLLAEIQEHLSATAPGPQLTCQYDERLLLSLAALVTTTARNDIESQLGLLVFDFVRKFFGTSKFTKENALQYVEALGDVRRCQEQDERILELGVNSINPMQVQLLMVDRARKETASLQPWLDSLNSIYASLDMSPIKLLDDQTRPVMDRLASATNRVVDGPKISVIMPTYAPGEGIQTAIRGLLEQTWKNLEILVIDDGSPSEYDAVLASIASKDPRIQVLKQQENAGAYVARNAGLAKATGIFVTTHDDDDWSHPDKIAIQAEALMDDDELVATTTAHIRTTPNMHFTRINSKPLHLQKNYSSLMFRREVVSGIGPWDDVNRGADSEFEARLTQHYGKYKRLDLKEIPASFSRVWEGSLTSGELRRGYQAYSRQLYYQAYSQWHRKDALSNIRQDDSRLFPVPTTFQAGFRNADLGLFDVIFASDYYAAAKDVEAVLQNLEAAVKAGLRVGFMLLDSPRTPQRKHIVPQLFDLQHKGAITQVSHDDRASTRLLVVYDASIGMYLDEVQSTVYPYRAVVVCDGSPRLIGQENREATLLQQSLLNLDSSFSTQFEVATTSAVLRDLVNRSLPRTRLIAEEFIWNTPLDLGNNGVPDPPTGRPVIGYHSFANSYRWPSTAGVFDSVYVSDNYKCVLYGHLQPMIGKYGEGVVDQIEVLDTETISLEDFWQRVHFWVYYPDDRLVETQPWRPVLEALQRGKIVILPERLRAIYGDAAVYVSAASIEAVVTEYTADEGRYREQSLRGQKFVNERFSQQSYAQMLSKLLS